jgi:hypothetical protein
MTLRCPSIRADRAAMSTAERWPPVIAIIETTIPKT